jgi:hypothetical protein
MRQPRGFRFGAGLALLCGVLQASACYRYVHVPLGDAQAGRQVRLHLTDSGFARFSAEVGEGVSRPSRVVAGDVLQADTQRLLVAVRVRSQESASPQPLTQRVAIPLSDVSHAELRQLDRKRTTVLGVTAGIVLGAIIAHYVGGVFGGTTVPRPDPGPGELIRPGVRFSR